MFRDLGWPWYVLPLHAALILHLLVLNALYRWRLRHRVSMQCPCEGQMTRRNNCCLCGSDADFFTACSRRALMR